MTEDSVGRHPGQALGVEKTLRLVRNWSDLDTSQLRERFDGLYIANGGYDRERSLQAITSGAADMVAIGVPFMANPDLPERFRRKAPLNEADQATFYGGDEHGYTDYPALESV